VRGIESSEIEEFKIGMLRAGLRKATQARICGRIALRIFLQSGRFLKKKMAAIP
jgi:hypothetical protein